ncbi:MAG: hypothetical protein NTZ97_00345 [Candidatus Moranbacteria bacterium]|nr:hypothetical protein [Candidatus Moranbacteria bacterium]
MKNTIILLVGIFWLAGCSPKIALPNISLDATQRTQEADEKNISAPDQNVSAPAEPDIQLGYIKSVSEKNEKKYLSIDYIQWLAGEEAVAAKRKDGTCPKKGECIVENDYYIQNENSQIRNFEIIPEVEINMQTLHIGEEGGDIQWNENVTFEKFKNIFQEAEAKRFKQTPFEIELQDNKIIRITERYIP